MKKVRKVLAFTLILTIIIGILSISPLTIGAADTDEQNVGFYKEEIVMKVGETRKLVISPTYISIEGNSWYSSDTDVVTCDKPASNSNTNWINAIAPGEAYVTGTIFSFQLNPLDRTRDTMIYHVTVLGNSGSSPASAKPGTPKISSVSYNGSSNTIKWSAANKATQYKVAQKKTGQSDFKYFTTSSTSLNINNVTAGLQYTYQVQALNGSTTGSWSSGKSVVTMTKPTLSVSKLANGIRADWNSVNGATKYNLYIKAETDSNWKRATTSNTHYSISGTVVGRKYYLQVQPIGSSSVAGPYSSVQSIVYSSAAMSVKPTVTVTNKSNGIRVEWNKINGATSYIVYYRSASASGWSSVTTTNTYYPYLSAKNGTLYYFQVLPMFGTAKGTYSQVKSITYYSVSSEKPQVTVSNKSNGIRVEWNKINGATSYIVYYRSSSASSWSSATTSNTYYLYSGAKSGTLYYLQVQPVFGSTKGNYSQVKSITYSTATKEKPQVTVSNNSTGIRVKWDKVSGATSYIVYYMVYGSGSWSSVTTNNTYYQYNKGNYATRYCFQVQPVFNGEKGAYSSVHSITFAPTETESISKPSGLNLSVDYGVDVRWNAVSGATAYIVARQKYGAASGEYQYYTVYNTTYFWDRSSNDLEKGNYYFYWVRALKPSGDGYKYGQWSSPATVYYK